MNPITARRGLATMITCITAFMAIAMARATDAADAQPLRLAPVIIRDPQVNNLEALRFLAPVGWKTEGGIVWKHDTWLLATLSMRVSDPASRASIIVHPADTFTWSQGAAQVTGGVAGRRYMGSLVMRLPDSVPDVITHMIVPGVRPQLRGAQVTDTEDLPALAKVILQQYQEAGFAKTCQASRVRFAYNDSDGTPMEEDIYAVVIKTPMPQIGAISWVLERAYSVRTERGKLDALRPVLTTLLASARLGQDWVAGYNYVVQLRNAGEYVLSNDASFDPNKNSNGTWTPAERAGR